MTEPEKAEKGGEHMYRITVAGTRINEVYTTGEHFTEHDIRLMWLNDVESKWGTEMREILEDKVNVRTICECKTT